MNIPDIIRQKSLIVRNCLHQIRITTKMDPTNLKYQLIPQIIQNR